MTPATQTKTIAGLKVTSTKLPVMLALDILPELLGVLGPSFAALSTVKMTSNVGELGDAIGAIAARLTGGQLAALAPRLLAGTSIVVPDTSGKPQKIDLVGGTDAINAAFEGRANAFLPTLRFAVEVTFKDFLDVSALSDAPTPTP